MKISYNESLYVASKNKKWERAVTTKLVYDCESREQSISYRDFAKKPALLDQRCGTGLKEKTASMHILL